jgi:hypothetical protein
MMRPMRRGRHHLGALLVAFLLTGCGTASPDYEIAGIDGLEIPTPSPDPDDFVARIDNPWLPLEPGNEWTYEVEGQMSGTTVVSVTEGTATVAGVEVVVVETRVEERSPGVEPTAPTTDYYAQDEAGNVWWFGRDGVWEAGVAGAEAGLAMPVDPRIGDGWRRALLEGVAEDRVTVIEVDGDLVVLQHEDTGVPGEVVQETYEAGRGLVRTFNLEGPYRTSELDSGP